MNAMNNFELGNTDDYVDWFDVDGNIINCSDGGIIYIKDTYYWYGMELRPLPVAAHGLGGQTTLTGLVMYSSKDLYSWKREGIILPCSDDPTSDLYGPMRFERPKIIYNDRTKKYVLWCHYVKTPGDHTYEPNMGEAGVASCDTINGTYTWHGYSRPIDDKGFVRDCTLYKDHDAKAYFIYDRDVNDERCLHIVQLSDDYLTCTDHYKRIDTLWRREAASICYKNGYYYMITSGLFGWTPNPAKYYRAKAMMGPWEDMGDPYIDDTDGSAYNTQSTFIFSLEGKEETFILMAERHNIENFLHCSYIWLPIDFTDQNTLSVRYRTQWSLDTIKSQA